MMHRYEVTWIVAMCILAGVVGCKSDATSTPPQQPPTASRPDAGSTSAGGVTSEQVRLMTVLRDYQLPAQSVPPARHADPQVDSVLQKMMAVANQQGLIFDGSRAAEGVIVVGRPGKSGKPMLVGVAVYPKSGRVAMQDTMMANALDNRDAERMKERYLSAL